MQARYEPEWCASSCSDGGHRHGLTKEARCRRPGRAVRGPGGRPATKEHPGHGPQRGRSARNEPDFVRRAMDVTGTLTVTEPKRRAVACSAQVCARPGTTPTNHRPAPPSRHPHESRWTQAHTCKLSHRGGRGRIGRRTNGGVFFLEFAWQTVFILLSTSQSGCFSLNLRSLFSAVVKCNSIRRTPLERVN